MADFGSSTDFGSSASFGGGEQKVIPSNLRVKVSDNQIVISSNLKVLIGRFQLTQSSNLRVKALDVQLIKSSNLKVVILDQQIIISSNLKVVILDQEIIIPSNLRVKVLDQQIQKTSNLRIKIVDNQIILSSNLRVKTTIQKQIISNLRVKIFDQQKIISSNLNVVLVFTTEFTPSCTFDSYELNATSGAHVDESVDFGIQEGTRTIIGFQSDPYENTYTNDDLHEIIYDVTSNSGTANYYHTPVVNGLSGNHEKTAGMTQQNWNAVWTQISGTVDVSGDFTGSGSQINISVPNTGTVWSPPTPSGSNVYDIPALHNGTLIIVNSPSDWDGNLEHKIHDWCPYQINFGHAVEVSDMDLLSGTHVNNLIKVFGVINTDYLIDFKVYHVSPEQWEWFSGATQIDSGTITGHTTNVWDFVNDLDIGARSGAGTYNHTLKLYSASGTFQHPSDPVRIMDIEFIIP